MQTCGIDRLIYILCLYENYTRSTRVSLLVLISSTNDRDSSNNKDLNEPIRYIDDSLNNNPMPSTTSVYIQNPITNNIHILFHITFIYYKHP